MRGNNESTQACHFSNHIQRLKFSMSVTSKKLHIIISSLNHFAFFSIPRTLGLFFFYFAKSFSLLKMISSDSKEYLTFKHALILIQNALTHLMYTQHSTNKIMLQKLTEFIS